MDNKRNWKGYLYILPVLVIVGLFTVYPLVQVFAMSFFQKYDFSSGKFQSLGLANYRYLMQGRFFRKPFRTPLYMCWWSRPSRSGCRCCWLLR